MLKKIIMCLIFVYSSNACSEIYKWVDEQGKTNYGDKPVNNSKEMDVDVSKKGHVKVKDSRELKREKLLETYADDRQRENEEKASRKKQKKKHEKNCARSKDQLRRYEHASSLYRLDKEGNRITMPAREKEIQTAELRKNIKKYCN
jgi:catalase